MLDEEEEHMNKSQYAGLGCQIANDGEPLAAVDVPSTYYGGKVHFKAKLVPRSEDQSASADARSKFSIVLERVEVGTSNSFARRFGSSRFLRLSIPLPTIAGRGSKAAQARSRDELGGLLVRPVVMNGCVYRAFFSRESNVYFVRTDEVCVDACVSLAPSNSASPVKSLVSFLNWYNPMLCNKNQVFYAVRFPRLGTDHTK